MAFEGRFELAVAMVLVAAFLDGIDGRLARMMKATSKFGAQMDSLADIVNFGVAPAGALCLRARSGYRSLGWIAALIYVIAAGLRLRASTSWPTRDQGGLAVGILRRCTGRRAPCWCCCRCISAFSESCRTGPSLWSARPIPFLIGFLLVCRLPVWSGKSSNHIRRDLVLPIILVVVLYVATLMTYTWETMVVTAIGYLATLPFGARKWQKKYGTTWPDHPDHPAVGEPGLPGRSRRALKQRKSRLFEAAFLTGEDYSGIR